MQALLRVEQNPNSEDSYQLLGYEWLEVLWVEPWALAVPDEGYGPWCDRKIAVQYVCMTEAGVTRIAADDFWTALEEYAEYTTAHKAAGEQAPLQIVAGAGSVVHVGSSHGSSFGSVGSAGTVSFNQRSSADTELRSLLLEVRQLRESLPPSGDRDDQIRAGALAEAEAALERDEPAAAAGALRRTGTWAVGAANKLGLGLLEAFLRQQAGL